MVSACCGRAREVFEGGRRPRWALIDATEGADEGMDDVDIPELRVAPAWRYGFLLGCQRATVRGSTALKLAGRDDRAVERGTHARRVEVGGRSWKFIFVEAGSSSKA